MLRRPWLHDLADWSIGPGEKPTGRSSVGGVILAHEGGLRDPERPYQAPYQAPCLVVGLISLLDDVNDFDLPGQCAGIRTASADEDHLGADLEVVERRLSALPHVPFHLVVALLLC